MRIKLSLDGGSDWIVYSLYKYESLLLVEQSLVIWVKVANGVETLSDNRSDFPSDSDVDLVI